MQISVETDARLTDKQLIGFKNLFKFLLNRGTTQKGNVKIPFDGNGNIGHIECIAFHDISQPVNGNGASALVETEHKP